MAVVALLLSRASVVAAAAAVVLLVFAVEASAASVASPSPPRLFVVGGEQRGWSEPKPTDETYNHWAARNRFHIGDFLDFKYAKNDSVLLVSRKKYKICSGEGAEQRFDTGGNARFRLSRNGDFYFISDAPGHCDAGQRMTVRVVTEQHAGGDAPAVAPSPDGGDVSFSPPRSRSGGGGSSSSSSGSPPPATSPGGKTSAAAAGVTPSGAGGHGVAAVAAVAGAVLLVLA
uniref:Phytocyanin domain-containing protein n=1 Tax=Leersia perrieri TaxID=77586 RepID=A0A0D9WPC3_9ORYZ